MAAPITIRVELDTSEIGRAGPEIARRLSDSLNGGLNVAREAGRKAGDAFNSGMREALAKAVQLREQIGAVNAPNSRFTSGLRDAERDALQLAQARARLQTVNGNLAGAEQTLHTAIAATTQGTIAQVRAQTQLAQVQEKLRQSAERAAAAVDREAARITAEQRATLQLAQTRARLQVVNGNLTGAEQTLRTAIAANTQETTTRIRAQAQLIQIQERLRQSAGGVGAAFLRQASQIREAGESLQAAGSFFTNISRSLLGIGRTAIESAGQLERVRRSLATLDGDRAGQTFARLQQQATAAGVSLADYAIQVARVRSTQKLTADESEKLVLGLVNISRQVGATIDQQQRAVTALNQILSKNKIQAEELRGQLLEAIPNLAPIIEKRFGTLNAEEIERRFGARKFVQGLIEDMARLNRIPPTALERFQVSLENLALKLAPVGVRILDLLNRGLDPLLAMVDRVVGAFERMPPAMQEVIVIAGVLAVAFGPAVSAIGSLIQTAGAIGNLTVAYRQLSAAATTAGAATGAANAATAGAGITLGAIGGVLGVLGIALAAAGAAWVDYRRFTDESRASLNEWIATAGNAELAAQRTANRIAAANQKASEFANRPVYGPNVPQNVLPKAQEDALRADALRVLEGQLRTSGQLVEQQAPVIKVIESRQQAQKIIRERLDKLSREVGGDVSKARAALRKLRQTDTELAQALQFQEVSKGLSKTVSGSEGGKSVIERITREVARLKQEVTALERGGGKLFNLEIDRTNLQEAKSQLTEILKLRDSLDFIYTAEVPKTREGREEELRALQREKQARQDIIKLTEAQADADARLRVLRATRNVAPVALETRTEIRVEETRRALREKELDDHAELFDILTQINDRRRERARFEAAAFVEARRSVALSIRDAEATIDAENARARALRSQAARDAAAANAQANRLAENNNATQQILNNEAALREGLIAFEKDIALARSNQQVERVRQARSTAIQIQLIEDEIRALLSGDAGATGRATEAERAARRAEDLRTLQNLAVLRQQAAGGFADPELVTAAQRRAEEQRLEGTRNAAQEIIRLQDEIAHAGEDSATRQQLAYLKAVRSIQEANQAARDSVIQSQVELADKTIFHSERSNAAVLEHLNRQTQGLTDIATNLRTGIIDQTFNVAERGIEKLTKHLGIFKDSIAQILSGLARMILSKAFRVLFGLDGGGAGVQQPSFAGAGSSGSGFNLLNALGLGGQGGFLTPGFAGGPGAAGILNNARLLQQTFGLGFGISGPESLTATRPRRVFDTLQGGGSGILNALGLGNIRNLFQGFGLSSARAGTTLGPLAQLAPLLGLSAGSSLGGRSIFGQALGGIGGLLTGIGITGAPSFLGSGLLAGLFSNPITAIGGVAALIGSIFFGRAQQRASDEKQSGEWLNQAVDNIFRMRDAAKAGTLTDITEARKIFEDSILAEFIALINTLKTESVRTSRLTNQVRDLRALFEEHVVPHVRAAATRQSITLIPEFHIGGVSPQEQIAKLLKNEMVLTVEQQRKAIALVGFDIFKTIGVPNAGRLGLDGFRNYHDGGRVTLPSIAPVYAAPQPTTQSNDSRPLNIYVETVVDWDEQGFLRAYVRAARSEDGRRVNLRNLKEAKRNNEL